MMSKAYATAVSPANSRPGINRPGNRQGSGFLAQGSAGVAIRAEQDRSDSITGLVAHLRQAHEENEDGTAIDPTVPTVLTSVPGTANGVRFILANGGPLELHPASSVTSMKPPGILKSDPNQSVSAKGGRLAMIRELIASQDDSFKKVSEQFATSMAVISNEIKNRERNILKFKDAPEDEPYVPVSARVNIKLLGTKRIVETDAYQHEQEKLTEEIATFRNKVSGIMHSVSEMDIQAAITERLRTLVLQLLNVVNCHVYSQRVSFDRGEPIPVWSPDKLNGVIVLKYLESLKPEYFTQYLKLPNRETAYQIVPSVIPDITEVELETLLAEDLPGRDEELKTAVFAELDKFVPQTTSDLQQELEKRAKIEATKSKIKAFIQQNATKRATASTSKALEAARQKDAKIAYAAQGESSEPTDTAEGSVSTLTSSTADNPNFNIDIFADKITGIVEEKLKGERKKTYTELKKFFKNQNNSKKDRKRNAKGRTADTSSDSSSSESSDDSVSTEQPRTASRRHRNKRRSQSNPNPPKGKGKGKGRDREPKPDDGPKNNASQEKGKGRNNRNDNKARRGGKGKGGRGGK